MLYQYSASINGQKGQLSGSCPLSYIWQQMNSPNKTLPINLNVFPTFWYKSSSKGKLVMYKARHIYFYCKKSVCFSNNIKRLDINSPGWQIPRPWGLVLHCAVILQWGPFIPQIASHSPMCTELNVARTMTMVKWNCVHCENLYFRMKWNEMGKKRDRPRSNVFLDTLTCTSAHLGFIRGKLHTLMHKMQIFLQKGQHYMSRSFQNMHKPFKLILHNLSTQY